MSEYQIAWRASTKEVVVQAKGDALPANFTKIGEYHHSDADDALGKPDAHNHVLWHHVRDLLYKVNFTDMAAIKITIDVDYIALIDFTITPTSVTRTIGQTQQLTVAYTPNNASNQKITYTSSDPAKATVSPTGLITAIATGSAVITATSEDGGITKTCAVTIS